MRAFNCFDGATGDLISYLNVDSSLSTVFRWPPFFLLPLFFLPEFKNPTDTFWNQAMEAFPNASPIDMDVLFEIMDGDLELIQDCLDDFADACPAMLKEIETAIDSGDDASLEQSAHALKGSLRYLAASAAAEVADLLEGMGREKEVAGRRTQFERLEKECRKVAAFIESYPEGAP